MAQKNFSGGINTLLGGKSIEEKKKIIEKKSQKASIINEPQNTKPKNEVRATFVMDSILLDKIKAISYWEREKIKDTINRIFSEYMELYESKKGKIKLAPQKKK